MSGSQPVTPTQVNCWDVFTWNVTTCQWDTSGSQPAQPTLECWETATFDNTTCAWVVSGSQPAHQTNTNIQTKTNPDTH